MHWTIYTTGTKLHPCYRDAAEEYIKRIGRYAKIRTQHVRKPAGLATRWPQTGIRLALIPQGTLLSSEQWAGQIVDWQNTSAGPVTIVIGPCDFPVDATLSVSPMDMDPGLLLTILTEQIYRAYRIIHNQPYHK